MTFIDGTAVNEFVPGQAAIHERLEPAAEA